MNDKTIDLNDYNNAAKEEEIKSILLVVYKSLKDKGYDPYDQIVGYLLSGDPSYIPRYNDSRNLLKKQSRDAILYYLLKYNLEKEFDNEHE